MMARCTAVHSVLKVLPYLYFDRPVKKNKYVFPHAMLTTSVDVSTQLYFLSLP